MQRDGDRLLGVLHLGTAAPDAEFAFLELVHHPMHGLFLSLRLTGHDRVTLLAAPSTQRQARCSPTERAWSDGYQYHQPLPPLIQLLILICLRRGSIGFVAPDRVEKKT